MKEKIAYLTARYDELEWAAKQVQPLRLLDIWGSPHQETWRHGRNSYRGEDGMPYDHYEIGISDHFNQWTPEFVLADIASKRAVLDMAEEIESMSELIDGEWGSGQGGDGEGEALLDALLQPFAGRDDFPKEWRA